MLWLNHVVIIFIRHTLLPSISFEFLRIWARQILFDCSRSALIVAWKPMQKCCQEITIFKDSTQVNQMDNCLKQVSVYTLHFRCNSDNMSSHSSIDFVSKDYLISLSKKKFLMKYNAINFDWIWRSKNMCEILEV